MTIYFDNAATTFPKPEIVYATMDRFTRSAANPGRAAHTMALQSANVVYEARTLLAHMLGIAQPERLVFTPGCTHSLNVALKGLRFQPGDIIITSSLEHNSVTRPLRLLEKNQGVKIVVMPYAQKGIVDLHKFIQLMLELHPKLVLFSEGSNVTGEMLDLRSIAAICGAHKVMLMVDAAQTAGRTTPELAKHGVGIWCASGHKGFLGPAGVGLLYVAPNVELDSVIVGGTGSNSESLDMPLFYPDHLEPGTLPGPAIAGLGAGARWLMETGIDNVRQHELGLAQRFLSWASNSGKVYVYGNRQEGGLGLVSFYVPGVGCDYVAQVLDQEWGIAVRHGMHCAAAAHQALGTLEFGLVRASFGYFNTAQEVDLLCSALESITQRRDAGLLQQAHQS